MGPRSAVLAAALLLAAPAAVRGEEPAPLTEAEAAAAVGAALPEGWKVLRTAASSLPDGWVSDDGGGVLVEGSDGKTRFRAWFLPRAWIGVCPRPPEDVLRRHGGGIQSRDPWKCTILCDTPELAPALSRGLGATPAMIRGGAAPAGEVFGADLAAVDARARALVEERCIADVDRQGAVQSLLLLGVPAPSLYREEALRGWGPAAENCAWALAEFPGRETTTALGTVVETASKDEVVKAAAMALARLGDREAGPALLRGLKRVRWDEAADALADALDRIRWTEAGPLLLRKMRETESPYLKPRYARVLASLRYGPALEEIRALAGPVEFTAEWIREQWKREYLGRVPGVALLRMTGPWGEPAGGVRLLLLGPETVEGGKKPEVSLVVENVGDEDRMVVDDLAGNAVVDGVPFPQVFGWDGNSTLRVNDVWVWNLLLPDAAAEPGTHRIRFESGKARSNEIEVVVPVKEEER